MLPIDKRQSIQDRLQCPVLLWWSYYKSPVALIVDR